MGQELNSAFKARDINQFQSSCYLGPTPGAKYCISQVQAGKWEVGKLDEQTGESWSNKGKILENDKRLSWSEPRKKMRGALQSLILEYQRDWKLWAVVSARSSGIADRDSKQMGGRKSCLFFWLSVSLGCPYGADTLSSLLPIKCYSSSGSWLIQKATYTYSVISYHVQS